jgi:hypothetical protein
VNTEQEQSKRKIESKRKFYRRLTEGMEVAAS